MANERRSFLYPLICFALFWLCFPASAQAQSLSARSPFLALEGSRQTATHWIGLEHHTPLSRQVSQFRNQGYELSGGQAINFNTWYSTDWQDMRLSWLTQVHPSWGFIWGFGTGERGQKYRIDPSLQLGLLMNQAIDPHSAWSLKVSTRVGGRLKEKPCEAFYNADPASGMQTVNCRLAASELPPEETLQYLLNTPPDDRLSLTVRYVRQF